MIQKKMFLTGVQRTHQTRLKAVAIILVLSLFLGGCSSEWWVGDGRGDWGLDLYGGYFIDKINSMDVAFCRREEPYITDSGETFISSTIVLPNYFVTAFLLREPYICLEGIQTEQWSISEEELNARVLIYYLVNTETDEIYGPYESYIDLITFCHSLGIKTKKDEWIQIDNRSDSPPTLPE